MSVTTEKLYEQLITDIDGKQPSVKVIQNVSYATFVLGI